MPDTAVRIDETASIKALSDQTPALLTMDSIVAQAPPAVLRPLGFLVSWQGVLALAYT